MVAPTHTSTPDGEPSASKSVWIAGGCILLGIIALSQCSPTQNAANSSTTIANYDGDVSNGIAAQQPPAPEPMSTAGVARGIAHLRKVFAAESFSGAMIYSQNCYDALGHDFSWAKLDQCGAFDALAARSAADADMTGFDNEASWFQSEVAAGRYLSAATGAGEAADEADRRLSQLQSKAARSKTVGLRQAPATGSGIENIINGVIAEDGGETDD